MNLRAITICALAAAAALAPLWAAAAEAPDRIARGSGDLGIVVERAAGRVVVVETSTPSRLYAIDGLGDLSHASAVFSRDQRYAYLFGRDGGLSKLDLLRGALVKRVIQAGNSIGGAISQDGRVVAVSNYEPGGVRLFDAETLAPLGEIAATAADGSAPRSSGWSTRRTTGSCSRCTTPARSGAPTSPIRARPRCCATATSAACRTTA